MTSSSRWRDTVREALLDTLAIIAPTECSGCGTADRAMCGTCRHALRPRVRRVEVAGVGPVWHALDYEGVARRVLIAFKDGRRTDAVARLATPLTAAVAAAIDATTGATIVKAGHRVAHGAGTPEMVTVPSGRAAFRRRGYHPVGLVLARCGLRRARVLRNRRAIGDQAPLGAEARRSNRAQSLRAKGSLDGRAFLIVDDILTSGATLREVARALREAGGSVVGGAVIAYTRLTHAPCSILPE